MTCGISLWETCAARSAWWIKRPICSTRACAKTSAYARAGASDDEIAEAARAAAIHDRILALPGGYAAIIAERGQTLSAGERQRIAIARALLLNPKVLVLDEPTSALDEANERAIAETLVRITEGRTVILITHRASLARIAQQTITLP